MCGGDSYVEEGGGVREGKLRKAGWTGLRLLDS